MSRLVPNTTCYKDFDITQTRVVVMEVTSRMLQKPVLLVVTAHVVAVIAIVAVAEIEVRTHTLSPRPSPLFSLIIESR